MLTYLLGKETVDSSACQVVLDSERKHLVCASFFAAT